jgi:hypothetical protein
MNIDAYVRLQNPKKMILMQQIANNEKKVARSVEHLSSGVVGPYALNGGATDPSPVPRIGLNWENATFSVVY